MIKLVNGVPVQMSQKEQDDWVKSVDLIPPPEQPKNATQLLIDALIEKGVITLDDLGANNGHQ